MLKKEEDLACLNGNLKGLLETCFGVSSNLQTRLLSPLTLCHELSCWVNKLAKVSLTCIAVGLLSWLCCLYSYNLSHNLHLN